MEKKIDINRKIPKITLISASVFMKHITDGIQEIYNELGKIFEFKSYFLNDVDSGKVKKEDFIKEVYESEVMLIDIRGNCPTVEILVETYKKMENENPELFEEKTIVALVGGNSEIRRITKMGPFLARKIPAPKGTEYGIDEIPDLTDAMRFGQKMTELMRLLGKILPIKSLRHARYWVLMMDYWVYGFAGMSLNHKNMILFLLKHYLGIKDLDVPKPVKIPSYGIYDIQLNKYFNKIENYLSEKPLNPNKQTIGLFYYGGLYFEQSLPIVEEFTNYLSDYNIIPVFSDILTNVEAHEKFFFKKGLIIVSLIINLQYFQLNGGPLGGDGSVTLELFKKMDIQHFNPIIQFDMSYEEYQNSQEGLIPINQIIAVVMPELDGRIEMLTVGCMKNLGYSEEIHSDVLEVAPLLENIQFTTERIKKWLNLREKLNSEKKIAIIIYNYPPGEDKIGNAAYLDVSESLRNLINTLIKEGYTSEKLPEDKNLAEIFIKDGFVNNPKFTSIDNFNGKLLSKDKYLEYFNSLPTNLQQEIKEFWDEPIGKIMVENSSIKLPIIQLKNIYICLQPSRSIVSGDPNEYHNKNLPPHHQYLGFYRYIEDIIKADAIIHIGTHGTEEFLPGKECAGNCNDYNLNLLGSLPNIYYYHITNTSESAIAKRRANAVIINHAGPSFKNSDLYEDLERLESLIVEYQNQFSLGSSISVESVKSERIQDLEKEIDEIAKDLNLEYRSISELEDLLYRYKISIIPMGLHVLGKNYNLEEKFDLILMILINSGEIPPAIENIVSKFGTNEREQSENIKEYLMDIIKKLSLFVEINKNVVKKISKELETEYDLTQEDHYLMIEWIGNLLNRMDNSMEMSNIIHALEGGYIEPGLGGDPIRSPHIFPTGRNSFGFDPRLIPNTTAYRRGGEIAEKLIQNYKKENNKWPETVSVVLWAFETMKTGGETVGQIFNYLGVRAVKNKSIWTTELEVIPLEELNHPRINVITTICGIFRDTFPYILDLINHAVELVVDLDEPLEQNYVKKSAMELKEQGAENPEARVFGPPPGKYNTNLTDIISAGQWENEKELIDDYLNNMSYAYMRNQKVKRSVKTFSENIRKINLMSQIRDSSEYHITDLDHYYEFTGGLARTYEELSGIKANIYIADTSSKKIKVDTIEKSIKEGAITRTLNPRWIKGLLVHKYHGGQKIAEKVENILGLAATTHSVDNWIWDKSYEQYFENEEIREALIENNRFAMMDIIKNMLQADQRGYWDAPEEKIDNLKKLFLELENWVEMTY